jgi:hypothetical protein
LKLFAIEGKELMSMEEQEDGLVVEQVQDEEPTFIALGPETAAIIIRGIN